MTSKQQPPLSANLFIGFGLTVVLATTTISLIIFSSSFARGGSFLAPQLVLASDLFAAFCFLVIVRTARGTGSSVFPVALFCAVVLLASASLNGIALLYIYAASNNPSDWLSLVALGAISPVGRLAVAAVVTIASLHLLQAAKGLALRSKPARRIAVVAGTIMLAVLIMALAGLPPDTHPRRTSRDLRTVATAIEAYELDEPSFDRPFYVWPESASGDILQLLRSPIAVHRTAALADAPVIWSHCPQATLPDQLSTLATLQAISGAIEAYVLQDEYQIAQTNSLDVLAPVLQPGFIESLPTVDVWGYPLRVATQCGPRHASWQVLSTGQDGRLGPGKPAYSGPAPDPDTDLACGGVAGYPPREPPEE